MHLWGFHLNSWDLIFPLFIKLRTCANSNLYNILTWRFKSCNCYCRFLFDLAGRKNAQLFSLRSKKHKNQDLVWVTLGMLLTQWQEEVSMRLQFNPPLRNLITSLLKQLHSINWLIWNLKSLFCSPLLSCVIKKWDLCQVFKVWVLGLLQCFNNLSYFSFVLLAHPGVWLLLNDILAHFFPSSLNQTGSYTDNETNFSADCFL